MNHNSQEKSAFFISILKFTQRTTEEHLSCIQLYYSNKTKNNNSNRPNNKSMKQSLMPLNEMWEQQTVCNDDFRTKPKNCCACSSRSKLLHCLVYLLVLLVLVVASALHLMSTDFGRHNILQPLTDCYFLRNGEDYSGERTETRTGLPCQVNCYVQLYITAMDL